MKQLIVNADDFGMTEGVSRGILEAHQKGIVTSTTLLANGQAFDYAVALARAALQLGVGVHLNLSEGLPVAKPAGGRSTLINGQGRLYLTPGKLFAAIAGRRVLLADVEGELRAQIRKVIDAGIAPTHLDGHMHVHVLPGVSEIVVRIAGECGIPAIRCPVERIRNPLRGAHRVRAKEVGAHGVRAKKEFSEPPPGLGNQTRVGGRGPAIKRRLIALGVSSAALRLRWLANRARLAHPARFYGIAETGVLDAATIEEILGGLPADSRVSELMCHPGYVDADLAGVGGELQAQRQTELEALTSPAVIEQLKREEIRLVNYASLAPGKNAATGRS